MRDKLIKIIERYFPSLWSTSPGTDSIHLNVGPGYEIHTRDAVEKVRVLSKGNAHSILGLTEGRWQSLASFDMWAQTQKENAGKSKFPTFTQYLAEQEEEPSFLRKAAPYALGAAALGGLGYAAHAGKLPGAIGKGWASGIGSKASTVTKGSSEAVSKAWGNRPDWAMGDMYDRFIKANHGVMDGPGFEGFPGLEAWLAHRDKLPYTGAGFRIP